MCRVLRSGACAGSFLLLLVLAALGCAGDKEPSGDEAPTGDGGADKTYQGNGYSFSYPGTWDEQAPPASNTAGFDVAVGRTREADSVSFVSLASSPDVVPYAITDANIDELIRTLRPALAKQFQSVGTAFDTDPSKVSYAGLPGMLTEASSTERDPPLHYRDVWLWDGTTQYIVNCQFEDSEADEVSDACDLVLKSLRISP